jgi:hypothetical protein
VVGTHNSTLAALALLVLNKAQELVDCVWDCVQSTRLGGKLSDENLVLAITNASLVTSAFKHCLISVGAIQSENTVARNNQEVLSHSRAPLVVTNIINALAELA